LKSLLHDNRIVQRPLSTVVLRVTRLRALAAAVVMFSCAWVLASAAVIADTSPSPRPVLAGIVLSQRSGLADTSVTVTGSGFPAGPVDVYFDGNSQAFSERTAADSSGGFGFAVTVYSTLGDHTICADGYGQSSTPQATACALFTLTGYQAKITVSPESGPLGTGVTISGTGFPPNELVALYLDSPNPYFGTPGPGSDERGNFSADSSIPMRAGGIHNVCGDTGLPAFGNQRFAVLVCAHFTITGLDYSSPSPTPTTDHSPTPSTPSPISTARPARTTLSAFVIGSVASGVAVVLAVGAGLFFWIRRQARPHS